MIEDIQTAIRAMFYLVLCVIGAWLFVGLMFLPAVIIEAVRK